MKNDIIQHLLERYREGTLSDSERAELNRLTHRDEVMAQAERQAGGIVRRRRSALFSAAGLMVAGLAAWSLLGPRHAEAPLVAEAAVPAVVAPQPAAVEHLAPTTPATVQRAAVRTAPVGTKKAAPATTAARTAPRVEEPVVVCNNQCEADSVINDIWKFLTV